MIEYRIYLPGQCAQPIAQSTRETQRQASRRCARILSAHPSAIRVEAWRDGRYLTRASRSPDAAQPVASDDGDALDFSAETMGRARRAS